MYKLIHREREAECVHPDAETRQTMRVKDGDSRPTHTTIEKEKCFGLRNELNVKKRRWMAEAAAAAIATRREKCNKYIGIK